jgi:hypothetical protein
MKIETIFSDHVRVDVRHGEGAELLSLTDLWKEAGSQHGKEPAHWARTDQAQALIAQVREMIDCTDMCNQCFRVVRTPGLEHGTWAVFELAVPYAQWLSPAFHVQTIREWRALKEAAQETGSRPLGAVLSVMNAIADRIASIEARIAATEKSSLGVITGAENKQIRAAIRELSKQWVDYGWATSRGSANARITIAVKKAVGWGTTSWSLLPSQLHGKVWAVIRDMQRQLLSAISAKNQRSQLVMFTEKPN